MKQQAQWVGIDVSKANLDVHLRPSSQQFQVRNQTNGIDQLVKQLQAFEIKQVVLEASGVRWNQKTGQVNKLHSSNPC